MKLKKKRKKLTLEQRVEALEADNIHLESKIDDMNNDIVQLNNGVIHIYNQVFQPSLFTRFVNRVKEIFHELFS